MFRNIFSQIEGVTDFPMAVLVFFFLFFVGVILMVFSLRKETISHMASLPLDKQEGSYLPKYDKKSGNIADERNLNQAR